MRIGSQGKLPVPKPEGWCIAASTTSRGMRRRNITPKRAKILTAIWL